MEVQLVLTFAEANALLQTANIGGAHSIELGMPPNLKAQDALKKLVVGMGFSRLGV